MIANPQFPDDSPTAWFAALERAIRAGDLTLARRCETELHRLGVAIAINPSTIIGLTKQTREVKP